MLPKNYRVLNAKERKKLLKVLFDQFGITKLPIGAYFENGKERVYLINRDIDVLDLSLLRVDAIGLYIGAWQKDGFRLSIEGAQLLYPLCTKNVYNLPDCSRHAWLKGDDLEYDGERSDFVLVKSGDDILGTGKFRTSRDGKDGVLLNYTPKSRRLIVVNE